MKPCEIKGALIARFGSVNAAANAFGVRVQELGHCMQMRRPYFNIRRQISAALGKPVRDIFPPSKSEHRNNKQAA